MFVLGLGVGMSVGLGVCLGVGMSVRLGLLKIVVSRPETKSYSLQM